MTIENSNHSEYQNPKLLSNNVNHRTVRNFKLRHETAVDERKCGGEQCGEHKTGESGIRRGA